MSRGNPILMLLALLGGVVFPGEAFAEDGVTQGQFVANNVWLMLATGLVFTMHLGFATLEPGMTQAKNTTTSCSRTPSSSRSAS